MISLLVRGIIEVLWPPLTRCLLCQAALDGSGAANLDRPYTCLRCWEEMGFPREGHRCCNCARPMVGTVGRCSECEQGSVFGRVWAIGLHQGSLREAIHHLKFSGREELGPALGRRLGSLLTEHFDLLVPVPLHRARARERGYNQAALIARGIGLTTSTPVEEQTLARLRSTGHQARLDRADRLANLVGAFGVSPGRTLRWAGRRVLLVDDVLTTGATAAAAAAVVRHNGAADVGLAVLAVSTAPVPAKAVDMRQMPINN